jgi:hypothetical protein
MAARALVGAVGIWLIGLTMLSAVKAVVLPRAERAAISTMVFGFTRRLFRLVAARRSFETADRILALSAPLSLLLLPLAWLVLITLGFAAVFWAAGYGPPLESLYASGSSVTTLGTAPMIRTTHRLIAFTEAGLGLMVVALLITFLPTLYAAFARRETLVALLEVRAGSPPTAVEMLQRAHRIRGLQTLTDLFEEWEQWFAEVEQSHTAFPILTFFRSSRSDQSWLTAAGAVLDTAALFASTIEWPPSPQAGFCIRAGYITLRRIAAFFGAELNLDPAPGDPIAITQAEFDQAYDMLAGAGLPVRADRVQAWNDFSGWRVNYDTPLLFLAELVLAPYGPWTSDRSPIDHRPPNVSGWGHRTG